LQRWHLCTSVEDVLSCIKATTLHLLAAFVYMALGRNTMIAKCIMIRQTRFLFSFLWREKAGSLESDDACRAKYRVIFDVTI
jgi:hypothetical protein